MKNIMFLSPCALQNVMNQNFSPIYFTILRNFKVYGIDDILVTTP
jgi:hypothetical protein